MAFRFPRVALLLLSAALLASAAWADRKPSPFNSVQLDIPIDGGGVVSYTRVYRLGKSLRLGGVVGAGEVDRDFQLKEGGDKWNAHTKAIVTPFIGPELTFGLSYIGVSLSYAAFYAKTDFTVDAPGETLSGKTHGWGSAVYAPLLVLDFYDSKRDVVFGFGLGGFLGVNYPHLVANGQTMSVETNANPLDTLTVHFRIAWTDRRHDIDTPADADDDF